MYLRAEAIFNALILGKTETIISGKLNQIANLLISGVKVIIGPTFIILNKAPEKSFFCLL